MTHFRYEALILVIFISIERNISYTHNKNRLKVFVMSWPLLRSWLIYSDFLILSYYGTISFVTIHNLFINNSNLVNHNWSRYQLMNLTTQILHQFHNIVSAGHNIIFIQLKSIISKYYTILYIEPSFRGIISFKINS